MTKGWRNNKYKHSLAAKGIPTKGKPIDIRTKYNVPIWFDDGISKTKQKEIQDVFDYFEKYVLTKNEFKTLKGIYFNSEPLEDETHGHHQHNAIHVHDVNNKNIREIRAVLTHEIGHNTWHRLWEERRDDEELKSLVGDFVIASMEEGGISKYSKSYEVDINDKNFLRYLDENYSETNRLFEMFRNIHSYGHVVDNIKRKYPDTYKSWIELKEYDDG